MEMPSVRSLPSILNYDVVEEQQQQQQKESDTIRRLHFQRTNYS